MRALILALTLLTASAASAEDFSWMVPLNDLGSAPYRWGYYGGLYEDGSNAMAADHLAAGLAASAKIQPLDADGNPSANGKIAFLAAGFGETARIMNSFLAIAASDRRIDRDRLVLVNGARDGADIRFWIEPPNGTPQYAAVNNIALAPAGVTPKQVQVAWVQMVNGPALQPLGFANGDAYQLKAHIAEILREMKQHYPNLRIAYLSSRVYGGYAKSGFNPEPYAYETGLSNRWVITAQMEQARMEIPEWHHDMLRVGVIDYRRNIAPWLAWGPYLWANGATPRADGLAWYPGDFAADGETLSPSGAVKGAKLLLDFLLHEPTAKGWFLSGFQPPARGRAARH